MPEISPMLLAAGGAGLLLGALIGWFFRSSRVKPEKEAIHASWQEQIAAQKNEHNRISLQNKNLMEQVSQFRATQREADGRANSLAGTLDNAVRECDRLRTELDEANTNLEAAAAERDRLEQEIDERPVFESQSAALKEKDRKIFKLGTELETWKNRLPPLLEKFRERDLAAEQLEVELQAANAKLAELRQQLVDDHKYEDRSMDETRVEPVDDGVLTSAMSASNEQYDDEADAAGGEEESPAEATDNRDTVSETIFQTITEPSETIEPVEDEASSMDATGHSDTISDTFRETVCKPTGDTITETVIDPTETVESAARQDTSLDATDHVDTIRETIMEASGVVESSEAVPESDDETKPRDDLKRIKGVGPAIEKTLASLGITRFEQIATMSDVEIDRLAEVLPGFKSRIYREDWIGQARELQNEETGPYAQA